MNADQEIKIQNHKVHIYTLSDPRTGFVRYVGKANDMGARFHAHLEGRGWTHKSKKDVGAKRKAAWACPILRKAQSERVKKRNEDREWEDALQRMEGGRA